MGTFYHIKYESSSSENYQFAVDSIFTGINNSLSTYISTSTISRVNQPEISVKIDEHFRKVFMKAKEIYKITDGAFDPTVMQLVNTWGFGYQERKDIDTTKIDSLLQYVGFDKVMLETIKIRDDTQKDRIVDYEGLIGEFLNDHWRRGTLIFDEGRVIHEPFGELIARVEIGNGTQYVAKSKFKKFLAEKGVGSAEFEKALEKSTVNLQSKKLRLSNGWKAGMNSPPVHVYAFQYEIPKEILDDKGSGT